MAPFSGKFFATFYMAFLGATRERLLLLSYAGNSKCLSAATYGRSKVGEVRTVTNTAVTEELFEVGLRVELQGLRLCEMLANYSMF